MPGTMEFKKERFNIVFDMKELRSCFSRDNVYLLL